MATPGCIEGFWCALLNRIEADFTASIFDPLIESFVSPAAYFKDTEDSWHYHNYLLWNDFLVYVNNEKDHPNKDLYKERITSLNKIGLAMFLNDTMVYPKESEHF